MSNQFIPNSFQLPNAVVDDLICDLTGSELKCYLVIVRKTKGWNKDCDAISISQLMEVTGLSNRAVIDACNRLTEIGLLTRQKGARGVNVFTPNLCKKFTSEESSPVKKVHSTCEESSQDPVKKVHTQNNNKNTTQNNNKKINKKSSVEQSEFELCFADFWQAGLVKVNRAKALKSFGTAFKSSGKSIREFTDMLVLDIRRRFSLGQFGFEKLHPTTYLNNRRWEDDYSQPENVKALPNPLNNKPDAHSGFAKKIYGETKTPEWAEDFINV
ncbi:replication protein [Avibacterium paragallinarum]|uniref:Phage replication protein O, N-terminal domain n=1 Tax=Avibacterium paragallinarum TaxID=728 RepID=A0A380X1J3_AVIPA|nr:replication protein [Avibacterium paragallinarum]SUU97091.1 phage replication protein O, N-terminal domain [Avibacterium paragallinarum]